MRLLLGYHAVSETWPADLAIAPGDFERHVRMLSWRGYRAVTFHEAVTATRHRKIVALTFDDAYRSVITRALPVLERVGFVGTVFVPTAFIGCSKPMVWPEVARWAASEHRDEMVAMSAEELQMLDSAGWEIGSHTRSHPHLTELDDGRLDEELVGSRADLEQILGRSCRSLAYPFGEHDPRVVDAARRAGYTAAAGTRPLRPTTGSLDVSRQVINRIDDGRRFAIKTSPPVQLLRTSSAGRRLIAARRARRARRAVPRSGG
jgi:peptidoglycan/xylan/chitin deacetylase (PgdA/CDA1 family)